MRHGALFNGIAGFMLAAEWMGWENVFSVEIDDWCNKVSKKNFPNVIQYGDIKTFKGEAGSVDILTAGFPCQPFSHAGKRKGKSDDRYLWPEYLRVIREIKPTYVVCENVTGLITMEDGKTLDGIFTDLEGEGYTIESFIIPACGVGAWHRRDRIWIIAYTNGKGLQKSARKKQPGIRKAKDSSEGSKSSRAITEGREYWSVEPSVGYLADGISPWMVEPNIPRVATGVKDRVNKLKGLGNAIVPQIAFEIFKAIENATLHR